MHNICSESVVSWERSLASVHLRSHFVCSQHGCQWHFCPASETYSENTEGSLLSLPDVWQSMMIISVTSFTFIRFTTWFRKWLRSSCCDEQVESCHVMAVPLLTSKMVNRLWVFTSKNMNNVARASSTYNVGIFVEAIMFECNDEHDASDFHVAEFSYHNRPSVTWSCTLVRTIY